MADDLAGLFNQSNQDIEGPAAQGNRIAVFQQQTFGCQQAKWTEQENFTVIQSARQVRLEIGRDAAFHAAKQHGTIYAPISTSDELRYFPISLLSHAKRPGETCKFQPGTQSSACR